MADQLPDWFTGGHGWDPSRLGDAPTNTKYAIADWAINNNVNLQNPDRDIASRIFEALKARFPQLSLVNPDTIDLGNGDGTIGVRPQDRNTNWDARQGQWGLDWIDPYHSNSQSNSAQAVAGTAPANVLPPGWQFPPMTTPRASAGTTPDYQAPTDKQKPGYDPPTPPPWAPWHPWDPGPPPPFETNPSNTGISGYGPGGIGVPPTVPSDTPPGMTPPWLPPDKIPAPTDYPDPTSPYPMPNDRKNPNAYPDQPTGPGKNPNDYPDIENIVQRALSRVLI